jgi:hypothetical protein
VDWTKREVSVASDWKQQTWTQQTTRRMDIYSHCN